MPVVSQLTIDTIHQRNPSLAAQLRSPGQSPTHAVTVPTDAPDLIETIHQIVHSTLLTYGIQPHIGETLQRIESTLTALATQLDQTPTAAPAPTPGPLSYASVVNTQSDRDPTIDARQRPPQPPRQLRRTAPVPATHSDATRILREGISQSQGPAIAQRDTRILYVAGIPRNRLSAIRASFTCYGIRGADVLHIDWHNDLCELIVRRLAGRHITITLRAQGFTVHDRLSIENPALFNEADWLALPQSERIAKSNQLFLTRLTSALPNCPAAYRPFIQRRIELTERFLSRFAASGNMSLSPGTRTSPDTVSARLPPDTPNTNTTPASLRSPSTTTPTPVTSSPPGVSQPKRDSAPALPIDDKPATTTDAPTADQPHRPL